MLWLLFCAFTIEVNASTPPNIIFIVADDLVNKLKLKYLYLGIFSNYTLN